MRKMKSEETAAILCLRNTFSQSARFNFLKVEEPGTSKKPGSQMIGNVSVFGTGDEGLLGLRAL